MKKLFKGIVVALLVCSFASFWGCGVFQKGLSGRYTFESGDGMTPAEFGQQAGVTLDENFITFTFKENGEVVYTMEYRSGGVTESGSGTGTWELRGDDLTLNFTGVRDGVMDSVGLQGTIHGTVQGGKIVIRDGSELVFSKALF